MTNNSLSVEDISSIISSKIQEINLPGEPTKLYDPIRYILRLGGKRLRPLLAIMSHNLFTDEINEVLLPAISIEVFHNFTLVHDDIMDEAPLRRGEATVHKKWDNNVAILAGDTMLVKAYELLSDAPDRILPQLLAAFNKTAVGVCEGQQLDMDFEGRSLVDNPVTESEYMNMIRLKTAVLFGFSLELGGIMGPATKEITKQLYEAGVHLGLAFQLQDDLLDLYGGEKFGKQIGGDILNAKKTYLLVKLLELASHDDKQKIASIMNNRSITDQDKIKAISEIYDQYHIANLTREQIKLHLDDFSKTIKAIDDFRSTKMIDFVNSLANRAI